MSKTVDELQRDFRKAFIEAKGSTLSAERAGIAAVVRALRDETAINSCACRFWLDDILGDAGDEVAHICDGDEGPSLHQSPATDPAPAPCLWRVHHETRNGPLYVSQCDGEWRHATADPKCPSCKKDIFFVTDPAPAVCVWEMEQPCVWVLGCDATIHIGFANEYKKCLSCGKPIKFTEAK